jgi:hypothetical protein
VVEPQHAGDARPVAALGEEAIAAAQLEHTVGREHRHGRQHAALEELVAASARPLPVDVDLVVEPLRVAPQRTLRLVLEPMSSGGEPTDQGVEPPDRPEDERNEPAGVRGHATVHGTPTDVARTGTFRQYQSDVRCAVRLGVTYYAVQRAERAEGFS